MIFKKISLSGYILISMLLGVFAGLIFIYFELTLFAKNFILPIGHLFLNFLKLLAVPIVFLSIINGIIGIREIKIFKQFALKTFLLYVLTTLIAIIIGLSLAYIIKPGISNKINENVLNSTINSSIPEADKYKSDDEIFLKIVKDLVPQNIINSLSDNKNMLQIIFIAIVIGVIILKIPQNQTINFCNFLKELNLIFIKLVDFVMKLAPVGVFALMTGLFIDFGGDISILKSLMFYALTVVSGLLLMVLVIYPLLIHFFSYKTVKDFFKAMYPAQIIAFSTSSSAATFPVTQRQVENGLNVDRKISSFVLPLGMTINMDGTSLYQTVAIIFIGQLLGIDFSTIQILTIIILSLLSSIGAPGIPGGSIVMMIFILESLNIPSTGLALILAIDRPLDMLRTVVNVTGDAVVCCLIDKNQKNRL